MGGFLIKHRALKAFAKQYLYHPQRANALPCYPEYAVAIFQVKADAAGRHVLL